MPVPPKSMKQGVYWVQKYRRYVYPRRKRQGGSSSGNRPISPLDLDYNELRQQCITFEEALVSLLSDTLMKPADASAIDEHVFALRRLMKQYGTAPTMTVTRLEELSLALVNAVFNVAIACMKYGLLSDRSISWSQDTKTIYISGESLFVIRHGGHIASFKYEMNDT